MVMQNPILNRFMKITQRFDREKERQKRAPSVPQDTETESEIYLRNLLQIYS